MKRHIIIYGALMFALLLTLSSCGDESLYDANSSNDLHKVTINAFSTIGNIDGTTRATLGGDGGVTPVWQKDDKIAAWVYGAGMVHSKLTLCEGEITKNGKFLGTVFTGEESDPKTLHFYYPSSVIDSDVDLTVQDGSDTKEMVMFASCDYSLEPSFTFENRTSILKLNIPVPNGSNWTAETDGLTATVYGAYSKGAMLYGNFNEVQTENISVSNIKVADGRLTGYVVVIPGSKVTGLRIVISDGTNSYVTKAYTNEEAVVAENNVITINAEVTRALMWETGVTTVQETLDCIDVAGSDLTIIANEMDDEDFEVLREALSEEYQSSNSINLTLLNLGSLPEYALYDCDALKSVYAPNVISVGLCAFENCNSLASVNLPAALDLGDIAFAGCTSLTSVSFPKVGTIGVLAFQDCDNLNSVSFPNVKIVKDTVFQNCDNLSSVYMPIAQGIGAYAFADCVKLSSVELPEVVSMEECIFCNCTTLSFVNLPKVEVVRGNAFYNCSALRTVSLPQAQKVESNAFDGCQITNIELTVKFGSTWWLPENQWGKVNQME